MKRKTAFGKLSEAGEMNSNINLNHRRDHAYRMRGKYLKAFVIFSILFASAIAYPNSYAESQVMLNLDKRVYVVGESVVVSGIVQSPSSNVAVIVQIWNSNNEVCSLHQVNVAEDGSFVTEPVKLSGTLCSMPGNYTITALYDGQEARTSFEVQASAAGTQNTSERLQTLLDIINKSRQNVDNKIKDVQDKGIKISDDVMGKYEQGLLEVQETEDAVAADDAVAAKQHAKNAMSAFRQVFAALTLLYDETKDEVAAESAEESDDLKRAEQVSELRQAIARATEFRNRLHNIAATSNPAGDVDANFSEFDNTIEQAKKLVEEGKIDEAARTLAQAHQILHDIQKSLMEQAKEQRLSKAKEFVQKTVRRIDEMIENAKAIGLPKDVIDALENAKAKLLAAESINEIVNIAKEIKSEKNEIAEEKGKNFERAVQHLESRLQEAKNRAQQMGMNADVFGRVQEAIDDAKAKWAAGETRNAVSILEKAELALSQTIGIMGSMKNLIDELNRLQNFAAELKQKVVDDQEALDTIGKAVVLINGAKETVTGATSEHDIQVAKSMFEQAKQLLEGVRNLVKPSPVPSINDSNTLKRMAQALEDRAKRLEEVAKKQENSEAMSIIMQAIDIIQKAKHMISEENFDSSKSLLNEANELLNKAERMLRSGTNVGSKPNVAVSDEKAKAIMQEIQMLEAVAADLKGKAGDNKKAQEHISEAVEDLNDAKGLVKEGHYDKAKSKVGDAKEHLRKAKALMDNSDSEEEEEEEEEEREERHKKDGEERERRKNSEG